MRRTLLTITSLLICLGMMAAQDAPPPTPKRVVTDDYFGTKIDDPYRYLEDLKDPNVVAWFKAQNDYTRRLLARIPGREKLYNRMFELDTASVRVNALQIAGGKYFYRKQPSDSNSLRLYVRDGLKGAERVLLDPDKLTTNGVHYNIEWHVPSLDGKLVAAGIAPGGSENAVLHLFDSATGKELPDRIERTQFGVVTWREDGKSFYYHRMRKLGPDEPVSNRYLKSAIYLHVFGTDPEQDPKIAGFGLSKEVAISETDFPILQRFPGSQWTLLFIAHGVQNEYTVYYAPNKEVSPTGTPWKKLFDVDEEVTSFEVHGDDFYLLSHKGASRFKMMRVHLPATGLSKAELLIPASQMVLREVRVAKDAAYVSARDGGIARLWRVPYGGKAEQVKLPIEGTIEEMFGDPRLEGVILLMSGWTTSQRYYAYSPGSNTATDTGLIPPSTADFSAITSEEVKAKAADGTEIPLSIIYERGIKLDGTHRTLLHGYGSYGISSDPIFRPASLAWLERGGVIAFAHVRGGGEYGEDWHLGGKKSTKMNTITDFIACAEYLVARKFTSPPYLAGEGTSAGGITIGGAITERPDLFTAALDNVGLSDDLRAELEVSGPANVVEFGTVKDEKEFHDLLKISAYHRVKDQTKYPAVLLTTGVNDPRVDPWQMAKMTARLQAATSSGRPVLLRVDYDGGHGFMGTTKKQRAELLADQMSFLLWQFGDPEFMPAQSGPPATPVRPVTETLHGVTITDPYRWMEDGGDEFTAWLTAQDAYTRAILERITGRENVLAEMRALTTDTDEVADLHRIGGRYVYLKRAAGSQVPKLYVRDDDGDERMLLDPAAVGDRTRRFTITELTPSPDGRHVALHLAANGGEIGRFQVLDVQTGRMLPDAIERAFSFNAWRPDGRAFAYTRLRDLPPNAPAAELELCATTYLHVLGAERDADQPLLGCGISPRIPVASNQEKGVLFSAASKYALAWVALDAARTTVAFYTAPVDAIAGAETPWRPLAGPEDQISEAVLHGDTAYLVSHRDAPRGRVIRTSIVRPDITGAVRIALPGDALIAPRARESDRGLFAASDALYVRVLDGGTSRIMRVPFGGSQIAAVPLPFQGAIHVVSTDPAAPGVVFSLESWTRARRFYTFDATSARVRDLDIVPPHRADRAEFNSSEVKVRSADGTLVPLSIVGAANLRRDGSHPAVLEAYGAYGAVYVPVFRPSLIPLLERGAIYAVCHARGGGEYGETWHLAGQKTHKANTIADFIACAEYLVAERYATKARLAGVGGSAGGLAIAGAITTRPDLFAAALPMVPIADLLRFEFTPNGPANIPEFGTVNDPNGFRAMLAVSPYEHITKGTRYPAVLVTTGINDRRVAPWQAAKFVARLQAATASGKPVLLRVDWGTGHGIGTTRADQERMLSDAFSFLFWQMGVPEFQPRGGSQLRHRDCHSCAGCRSDGATGRPSPAW